jgi:hypothetical protein
MSKTCWAGLDGGEAVTGWVGLAWTGMGYNLPGCAGPYWDMVGSAVFC